jgi:hypothetical protein
VESTLDDTNPQQWPLDELITLPAADVAVWMEDHGRAELAGAFRKGPVLITWQNSLEAARRLLLERVAGSTARLTSK